MKSQALSISQPVRTLGFLDCQGEAIHLPMVGKLEWEARIPMAVRLSLYSSYGEHRWYTTRDRVQECVVYRHQVGDASVPDLVLMTYYSRPQKDQVIFDLTDPRSRFGAHHLHAVVDVDELRLFMSRTFASVPAGAAHEVPTDDDFAALLNGGRS